MSIEQIQPEQSILNFFDDTDLTKIYDEWLSKNRSTDPQTQNGFIFEIISRKYLQGKEKSPGAILLLKEVLMSLLDGENQRHTWNEEKSSPDDLLLRLNHHSLEIVKIIECKISAHAAMKSFHQKESTKNTVKSLVGALNGDYHEIKNEKGKKIISHAREKLAKICHLPISLSPNYRYVYTLPSGEHYVSNHPKDANLEVINLPFSIQEIENFRKSFFGVATELQL